MKAHIHVTYQCHPDTYINNRRDSEPFPLKIKEAINAQFDKNKNYLEDRQIFSSEKYDGPELGILMSIHEVHIGKANGVKIERIKVECHVQEDTPSFKYFETHYEVSTTWVLPKNIINSLQENNIAYSFTKVNNAIKNILTVRHTNLNLNMHTYVKNITSSYGILVDKHYSEKVILDTNLDYDLGWAPLCKFEDNKLVIV